MERHIFDAYRSDGWHIFRLIKTKEGDGNAVKGLYTTPKGWNDPTKTYEYNPDWVYGGTPPKDIVAIDWDVKNGKNGLTSLTALEVAVGYNIDTVVSTPSGGGHAYCRIPPGIKLAKAQSHYPDIDFQGSGSEFVVLGGQSIEGYGDYTFVDEDFEYFVNPEIGLILVLEPRANRSEVQSYDDVDEFTHISERPSKDEVVQILNSLDPSGDHDSMWQPTAMALNSWDLGGPEGKQLFVEWSLRSTSHVKQYGEDAVRSEAEEKYDNCVASTPSYYNKLFSLSSAKAEQSIEDRIVLTQTVEGLEELAIEASKIKLGKKREPLIEKFCEKNKELTGKPERVKWKKGLQYFDEDRATARQDKADADGLPDFEYTKTGVKYLNTYANLEHFVKHLSGHTFLYDVILKRVIIDDTYDVQTGEYTLAYSKLSDEITRHGLPSGILASHFDAMIYSNIKNPLMDYIEALGDWDDGRNYIAEVAQTLTTDRATPAYTEAVIRSFAIQAIAAWDGKERTKHALSRLESVMVFVGKQGSGKTTWVGKLMPGFMTYYFKDGVELNPSDKDSYMQATNAGLVELGELDATNRKSDISSLKAFLSNLTDEFRAPYARFAERYKRQTVYVGTVNNTDFLKDATGSRRFLALDVIDIKLPSTEIVKGMWRQALHLYLSGEDWRLSDADIKLRNKLNASFTDIGAAGDLAEQFAASVKASTGPRVKFSLSMVLKKITEHKFSARERSDFIAVLDTHDISRYSDGKYYIPNDCFVNFVDQDGLFENLEEQL